MASVCVLRCGRKEKPSTHRTMQVQQMNAKCKPMFKIKIDRKRTKVEDNAN